MQPFRHSANMTHMLRLRLQDPSHHNTLNVFLFAHEEKHLPTHAKAGDLILLRNAIVRPSPSMCVACVRLIRALSIWVTLHSDTISAVLGHQDIHKRRAGGGKQRHAVVPVEAYESTRCREVLLGLP